MAHTERYSHAIIFNVSVIPEPGNVGHGTVKITHNNNDKKARLTLTIYPYFKETFHTYLIHIIVDNNLTTRNSIFKK